MSRTSKTLLSLMAVITLIQALWFVALEVYIPYVTDFFNSVKTMDENFIEVMAIVFAVVVALFALVMLIVALTSRSSERDLKLKDGKGNLTVPKKAMEKIIDKSIVNNHQVGNVQTKVKVHGRDRLQVRVQVEDLTDSNYGVNAKDIQQTVQDNVQRHLGMKSNVKVQVIPRERSTKSLKVI